MDMMHWLDNQTVKLEDFLELARIQKFYDCYKFRETNKDIGNAVDCKFAYHMANHLKKKCY